MFSVLHHGAMIADEVRLDAYTRALRYHLRPGATVLDLGAGSGVMTLLACRLGARHVFAVEPEESIQIARQAAHANGYDDRVTFFHGPSRDFEPEAPVDVVVSDLRGVLPPFGTHLSTLADARRRLLAPGGQLIPRGDRLLLAVVEAPELLARYTTPWETSVAGLDLSAGRHLAVNHWGRGRAGEDQLLTSPSCWSELDYRRAERDAVRGTVETTARRDGTGHGLLLWFETVLAPGIGFSTAPWERSTAYGSAFFPWPRPVAMARGDELRIQVRGDRVGSDYVWSWATRLEPRAGEAVSFQQSTFFGVPISAERLRQRSADHKPRLGLEGCIDRLILSLADGETAAGEIADRLRASYPKRFPQPADALARVCDLLERYGDR